MKTVQTYTKLLRNLANGEEMLGFHDMRDVATDTIRAYADKIDKLTTPTRNCDRGFKDAKEAEKVYWKERRELRDSMPNASERLRVLDNYPNLAEWLLQPINIVMFPSENDVVSTKPTETVKTQNMKKKTNPAKSDGFANRQTITHEHVRVPKAIADRIAKANGGTVVLENSTEAYNVGDLIGFDVVADRIGSLDTLHEICCDEGKLYEVTYVYSGRGIEPGYVLVQFRESDKKADGK